MTLIENFQEFRGLDYRSNDATRKQFYAKEVVNVEPSNNTGIVVAKGFKGISASAGGGGTASYVRVEPDGERIEELIRIDANLHREKLGVLTITYVGAGASVSASLLPHYDGLLPRFYLLKIIVDGSLVYFKELGPGVGEASPTTIGDLVTEIGAVTDFNCSATGTTTGPAAFLPTFEEAVDGSLDIEFSYSEQIYCPTTNPFSDFEASFLEDDFELADLLNTNNLLFIATGFNKLYKYDGLQTFAVGMPSATEFSSPSTFNGGSVDYSVDATRRYFITYEQTDNLSRVAEGDPSNIIEVTFSLNNDGANLTIPTIQPGTEYLTSCARANNGGTQTGFTLQVHTAHTLQVGQTAFFQDSGGTFHEDVITATDSTHITFANSYTIADEAPISANLRINIWREKAGTSEFFLVTTLVNDSTNATITYQDGKADEDLGARYEPPIEGHGVPPENLKYLTVYKGLIVGADGSDSVYFSDPDGPEYWNLNFRVRTKSNEPVRSVGSNKEILLVQKSEESTIVTGDLPGSNFTQEIHADAIGTESHHSVIDVEDTLWFMSSTQGVRRIVRSNDIADVSYRIEPALTERAPTDATTLVHRRVVAINAKHLQLALFFCPTETSQAGTPLPNSNSVVFVADYASQFDADVEYDQGGRPRQEIPRVRWWKWKGFNFAGGITSYAGELVWTERRYNEDALTLEYPLVQRLEAGDETDYHQHCHSFEWSYEGEWMGSPTTFYKWLKLTVHSYPQSGAPAFTINAATELDYKNGLTDSQKDLEFSPSGAGSGQGWSVDPWGTFPWGHPLSHQKLFTFKPTRAKSLKLRFSREVFLEQILISGWVTEVVPAYAEKIKEGASAE